TVRSRLSLSMQSALPLTPLLPATANEGIDSLALHGSPESNRFRVLRRLALGALDLPSSRRPFYATSILDVFVGHARQALCPPCQSWMNPTATHDHIRNERIEWWWGRDFHPRPHGLTHALYSACASALSYPTTIQ